MFQKKDWSRGTTSNILTWQMDQRYQLDTFHILKTDITEEVKVKLK